MSRRAGSSENAPEPRAPDALEPPAPEVSEPRGPHTPHRAPVITLYGRPGCCLCDDARAELESIRAQHPFTLREVDITRDDALHKRYLVRIPVIALDGKDLYDYVVDRVDLAQRLGRTPPEDGDGLE